MKIVREVLVGIVLVACAGSAATGQSLADVARKEAARREAIAAPAKVYTNESLRSVLPPAPLPGAVSAPVPDASTPGTASPPPTTPSGGSVGSSPGDEVTSPETGSGNDEAAWRTRMATARDNLSRSQVFAEALQSRINALTTDFTARDDPAQRAGIATDRQRALAELERVKQEIQQFQQEILTIQEDARRAGVPAGWVR